MDISVRLKVSDVFLLTEEQSSIALSLLSVTTLVAKALAFFRTSSSSLQCLSEK